MENFFPISRDILEHWVYSDIYAYRVWTHILLVTQYEKEPNKFHYNGYLITQEYGEFVYGRLSWSVRLQVPEQRLRTLMSMFEKDGMIAKTAKKLPRGTIYSVTNYAKFNQRTNQPTNHRNDLEPQEFQDDANQRTNTQTTSDQPATNQRLTTIKKDKKEKNRYVWVKPDLMDVESYCRERGNGIDPQTFIDYYEANGWIVGKTKMKDWKAAVRNWERNGYNKPKPKERDLFDGLFIQGR